MWCRLKNQAGGRCLQNDDHDGTSPPTEDNAIETQKKRELSNLAKSQVGKVSLLPPVQTLKKRREQAVPVVLLRSQEPLSVPSHTGGSKLSFLPVILPRSQEPL